MFCPDCDANLDAVPVDEVCPNCGGRRRSAVATPEAVSVVAITEEVIVKVSRGDLRPWVEKWQALVHLSDRLAEAYAGTFPEGGTMAIENYVNSFCVECHQFPSG